MHPLLKRQLKRLGIDDGEPPIGADWDALLARVDATYEQADQDRYTLERSLELSSAEMQQMYDDLQQSSQTQLALQRDKLSTTVATLEATLEASPDGVLVIDQHREVVDYNRRFLEIWQVPADVGRRLTSADLRAEVIAKAVDPPAFAALVERMWTENIEASRDDVVLADDRVVECRSRVVELATGAPLGRVWYFRDVTPDRRAERELRDTRDAAEKASKAKTGFLSNMSHEMRTPLNSILGFARVLDNEQFGKLNERQKECVGYLLHAAQHMLNLVNDLLDLRRIEEDRAAIVATRLPLGPVLAEAITLVRPLIDERQHEVTTVLEPDLPEVLADRRAVVQILVNLLSNAVKYTPNGGKIAVHARAGADLIVVAVEDNGVGIPAEDHAKLFTYFEQLGAKHEAGMRGSGIGLALTRALVERLGGHIRVNSAPGIGSTFEFSIPRWTEPS
jgi:signal transduction histidine kinase